MNVSSIGEALILLSSVLISAVQAETFPKVALQLILPSDIGLQASVLGKFEDLFRSQKYIMKSRTKNIEVKPVSSTMSSGPDGLLQTLCNDTFTNNVVTVIKINNPKMSKSFSVVNAYLSLLLESNGIPIISWDSEYVSTKRVSIFQPFIHLLFQRITCIAINNLYTLRN